MNILPTSKVTFLHLGPTTTRNSQSGSSLYSHFTSSIVFIQQNYRSKNIVLGTFFVNFLEKAESQDGQVKI